MLKGLGKIVDGLTEIIEPINPMVTDMTPENKAIASALLAEGITVKAIQDFVDVSRNQLDDFLDVEAEVLSRLNEKEAAKKAS